jgi:hypothetical protein
MSFFSVFVLLLLPRDKSICVNDKGVTMPSKCAKKIFWVLVCSFRSSRRLALLSQAVEVAHRRRVK